MIIDTIDNLPKYFNINKYLRFAVSFLKKNNLKKFAPGKYNICKKNVYAFISEGKGKGKKNAFLEAHRRYIDLPPKKWTL